MTQNEKQMSNAEQQKKIGKRFKELIKEFDGDQETTAQYLNYSKTSISRFCSGACPLPDEIIKKLSAKWDVREEYIKCIDDYKTVSDVITANRKYIRDTDNLLIQLLCAKDHRIVFNPPIDYTDVFTVTIDETNMEITDFEYMLDDIYDYINYVLSRKSIYPERREHTIAIDFSRSEGDYYFDLAFTRFRHKL